MVITEATNSDLQPMIDLLKVSLGEKLLPKSEAFFRWKHESNPFGASKTILAKEDGKVIGLRTFMQWRWSKGDNIVRAVRAVDTATDPAYQGRGIFKKLTLQAVESCTQEGISFVFNTPNPISMQGYLKMGWYVTGRMPVYVGPGSLFPARWNDGKSQEIKERFPVVKLIDAPTHGSVYHTAISNDYLQWRYNDCPVVAYGSVIKNECGIVFRLKPLKGFIELRICEAWSSKKSHRELVSALRSVIKFVKPALVSSAESPLLFAPFPFMFGPFRKGPVTTLRPLALDNLSEFNEFKNWQPSMGSLELF